MGEGHLMNQLDYPRSVKQVTDGVRLSLHSYKRRCFSQFWTISTQHKTESDNNYGLLVHSEKSNTKGSSCQVFLCILTAWSILFIRLSFICLNNKLLSFYDLTILCPGILMHDIKSYNRMGIFVFHVITEHANLNKEIQI